MKNENIIFYAANTQIGDCLAFDVGGIELLETNICMLLERVTSESRSYSVTANRVQWIVFSDSVCEFTLCSVYYKERSWKQSVFEFLILIGNGENLRYDWIILFLHTIFQFNWVIWKILTIAGFGLLWDLRMKDRYIFDSEEVKWLVLNKGLLWCLHAREMTWEVYCSSSSSCHYNYTCCSQFVQHNVGPM